MGDNSLIKERQLQSDLENFYNTKVYPYLNGATHTGCVPLGTILPYFGETAPTHFLICDGTEYAKSDYPELAEHLLALTNPTPYAGSDANHFKVPDLRGEFLRGSGTNSHANQGSGAAVGVHQDATVFSRYNLESSESEISFATDYNNSYLDFPKAADSSYNTGLKLSWKYLSFSRTYTPTNENVYYYTSKPTNTSVTYIIAYRNAYIDLALDSFPIDISNPTDGQLLMYDATAGRWVNGGHKYSTDEQIVDKWIDGRNVYEKIINFGALPNNSSKTAQSGLQNEKIIEMKCSSFSSANEWTVMIPNVDSTNPITLGYNYNNHTVVIKTITDRSAYTETYVTLKYIKTTDTV